MSNSYAASDTPWGQCHVGRCMRVPRTQRTRSRQRQRTPVVTAQLSNNSCVLHNSSMYYFLIIRLHGMCDDRKCGPMNMRLHCSKKGSHCTMRISIIMPLFKQVPSPTSSTRLSTATADTHVFSFLQSLSGLKIMRIQLKRSAIRGSGILPLLGYCLHLNMVMATSFSVRTYG